MKYGESIFDILYLVTIIVMGFLILKNAASGNTADRSAANGGAAKQKAGTGNAAAKISADRSHLRLFGFMALILGFGDAFHLVPRVLNYWLGDFTKAMGIGEMITAVTMTFFYVLLYRFCCIRYQIKEHRAGDVIVYGLTVLRVILVLLPQNDWANGSPYNWKIARNIPFVLLGLYLIILTYRKAKEYNDSAFRFLWLGITLSFAFYAPVVLFASAIPAFGALMLPKTIAYVWIVWMGYQTSKGR